VPGPARRGRKRGRLSPEAEAELRVTSRGRARLSAYVVLAGLLSVGLRASVLMLAPDARLEERAREQFQSAITVRGQRGAIVDSRGRILAATVALPSLYGNPSTAREGDLDRHLAAIAAATGKDEAWVRSRFEARASGRKLVEVELGRGLEPSAVATLVEAVRAEAAREKRRDPPWLFPRDEPTRIYPGRELGSPLIGFTDGNDAGSAGLERVLDRELRGDTYRVVRSHDRKGRAIDADIGARSVASAGHSVRLTLDAAVQASAEAALEEAMIRSRPLGAMAVVMDVRTGAIRAMASVPRGNPNDIPSRADMGAFKNRPAMDQVEPGSVFKPFIAAAAIEEGLVTPDTLVDCELGAWPIGGKVIKDDHPKGVITLVEVIKYSSNIGAAKLAFMLGADRTLRYVRDFGFGERTGLGLPGEVSGQVRKADSIRTVELATTAFGQGVTASPVQLVAAVATLANRGERMVPRLVEAVLDRNGVEESQFAPRVHRRVISPETADTVARMMETVIEEGGTGTRAAIPGFRVAGKTGTAQVVENGVYSPTRRVSSFVGFFPAERPEFAIAVVVDSPTVGSKYGGIVAAPAFSAIGSFLARYYGIEPTEPVPGKAVAEVVAPGMPLPIELSAGPGETWSIPDLRGLPMRRVLAALAPSGVQVQVEGSGVVIDQSPAPGQALAAGQSLSLRFQ
jgi:cell division protein FtsI (penicillin-binding protein 3)